MTERHSLTSQDILSRQTAASPDTDLQRAIDEIPKTWRQVRANSGEAAAQHIETARSMAIGYLFASEHVGGATPAQFVRNLTVLAAVSDKVQLPKHLLAHAFVSLDRYGQETANRVFTQFQKAARGTSLEFLFKSKRNSGGVIGRELGFVRPIHRKSFVASASAQSPYLH